MRTPTCPHGFNPSMCRACNGNYEPKYRPEPKSWGVTKAKLEGTCRRCWLPIHKGDRIAKNEAYGWVHEECS